MEDRGTERRCRHRRNTWTSPVTIVPPVCGARACCTFSTRITSSGQPVLPALRASITALHTTYIHIHTHTHTNTNKHKHTHASVTRVRRQRIRQCAPVEDSQMMEVCPTPPNLPAGGTAVRSVTCRETQTADDSDHGGPVAELQPTLTSSPASSSTPSHGACWCVCWCLVAEVACALNGASALVFWRRVVTSPSITTTPESTAAVRAPPSVSVLVASYHALLGGCFFHVVGCQMAVQLALRQRVNAARTDCRPPSIGTRSLRTSAWPATLWYVLSVLPVVVPQFKLVYDVGSTARLRLVPAFPVFVIALVLSVVLGAGTLSYVWCHWVVNALQRAGRHEAVRRQKTL